jgi:hypothetical protein
VLLLATGSVAAYPIDVTMLSEGLQVEAHSWQLGDGAMLEIVNGEPLAVRCDVLFRNGPERRLRKVIVEPAARQVVRFTPTRDVVRIRINIECRPAHQADEAAPERDPDIDLLIDDE